jgi:competence protein ComEC
MLDRTLGYRAPLLWLVIPLLVGLDLGQAAPMAPVPWLLAGSLLASGFAVWAAWHAPRRWGLALGGAMLLGGWASYALHRQRLADWEDLPPREVRLTLQVERIFPQKDPRRASGLARVVRDDLRTSGEGNELGPASGSLWRDLAGQRISYSLTLDAGQATPIPWQCCRAIPDRTPSMAISRAAASISA